MFRAGTAHTRHKGAVTFVQLRVDGRRLRTMRRVQDGSKLDLPRTQVCSSSTVDCRARQSSWLPYPGNDDDADFEQIGCMANEAVL